MRRVMVLFAALTASGCDRVTPERADTVLVFADSLAREATVYGAWIRRRDSSEMTDSLTYSAFLPADTLGNLTLLCHDGRIGVSLHSEDVLDASEGRVRVVARFDQRPAGTELWFTGSDFHLALAPAPVNKAWLAGTPPSADSLRLEIPVYQRGRQVLRFGLEGTDSTVAWLRGSCDQQRRELEERILSRDSAQRAYRADLSARAEAAQKEEDADVVRAQESLASRDSTLPWVSSRNGVYYYPNTAKCHDFIRLVHKDDLRYFKSEEDASAYGRSKAWRCAQP